MNFQSIATRTIVENTLLIGFVLHFGSRKSNCVGGALQGLSPFLVLQESLHCPNRAVCAFSLRSEESGPCHPPVGGRGGRGPRHIVFRRCGLGRREKILGIPCAS
jgi:hypothetical protein